MHRLSGRVRPWLAPAAVVLSLSMAVPPAGSFARQYAFAQAIQFVIFAVASPALLVLGWPSRFVAPVTPAFRRCRPGAGPSARPADQPGSAGQRATRSVAARLSPFLALVITWRLPAVLGALARHPALTAAELVTLAGPGAIVWLGLVPRPGAQPTLPRPLRAAMATAAMWTIWAIAYISGMTRIALAGARDVGPTAIVSAAADRQIAAAIMWAVPGVCFVPVVYAMLMPWLTDRMPSGKDSRAAAPTATAVANLASPPRPPRGWRRHEADLGAATPDGQGT